MKIKDLVSEAIAELNDEDHQIAKEEIKERLREIRSAKKVLAKLETQYTEMLDEDVEDAADIV